MCADSVLNETFNCVTHYTAGCPFYWTKARNRRLQIALYAIGNRCKSNIIEVIILILLLYLQFSSSFYHCLSYYIQ